MSTVYLRKNTGSPDFISAKDYGAVGDGTTDDTANMQAALDSGENIFLPDGNYVITDALNMSNGQKLFGRDRLSSILKVDAATFNMSALGVIVSPGSEPGGHITDIGIEFVQPSGSGEVRANMNQYPPAIYAVASPRTIIDRVRFSRGWDGIKLTGNSGGSYLGRIETGCYNTNIEIDGALDFIHGESWHAWPFGGSTGDLLAVWQDGDTVGLVVGDVDGFSLDKWAGFESRVDINGIASILPICFGTMQLDGSNSELNVTEGGVLISNLYSTKSTTETASSIKVTGGRVDVSNAHIQGGEAGYQIEVTGGRLSINGGEIYQNRSNGVSSSVSDGVLSLKNMTFRWPVGARTQPLIEQSGSGILIVTDCQPSHYTSATEVIDVTTDVLGTRVDATSLEPHTLTLPAATGSITAFADAGSGQVTVTSAAHGRTNGESVTITGTTNYNGTFTVAGSTTNTFEITDTWVSDDGTGTWLSSLSAGKYSKLDSWTASLTCGTPGDLSVSYGSRSGFIRMDGDFYDFHLRLVCTPTFTTASGNISITGFNITPTTASEFSVAMSSKVALNTNFTALGISNTSTGMTLQTHGDNQAITNVVMADIVSGVELTILVTGRGKI